VSGSAEERPQSKDLGRRSLGSDTPSRSSWIAGGSAGGALLSAISVFESRSLNCISHRAPVPILGRRRAAMAC